METELNFEGFNPELELSKTKNLLGGGVVAASAAADHGEQTETAKPEGKVLTDYKGNPVDPAIHMADENGNPVVSNGNIRLKKPSLRQKIAQRFSHEKKIEKDDLPNEKREIPLSDHEKEKEVRENLRDAESFQTRSMEIDASASTSAEMYFVGGAIALGPEFYNQKAKFYDRVKQQIAAYEEATNKSLDLPPGVALAIGLSSISYEIIKNEPECKKRFDGATAIVRANAQKYIGGVFEKTGTKEPEEDKKTKGSKSDD